jgi:outer membrane protein OmpA-like peptidoglycan-associated protein
MPNTLINSVSSVFTDDLISKFSVLLNEPQGNTQKAVQSAIPIVLTEVLRQAGSPDGATKIWSLSKQAAGNDFFGQIHELGVRSGNLVTGGVLLKKGSDSAASLLASRKEMVIKEIARYSGASVASASFIAGVVSFAALDSIGRQITAGSMDAKGLALWLDTQRESIMHAIPQGLEVKAPLGIRHYPRERAVRTRRYTMLSAALGVIVLGVAVFLIFFRPGKHSDLASVANPADTTVTAATSVSTTTPVTAATPVTAPTPVRTVRDTIRAETIHVNLPNGKVLDVYQGGTEDRLVTFLGDPNAKLHKKNGDWFNFTKIGFASNSSSLLLESEVQLKNIVSILTAFPKAKIKIGGYSDNTGDPTDNVRLSQQRADNIYAKLIDLDTKPSQLKGAKGYGPRYPVGDNGTAAGRNMNRRMSLDVVAK